MDPLTHGLASLALQRGFFPRASWRAVLVIISAGVVADLDWFTAAFGPSAYLHAHRSATHSIIFILLLAVAAFLFRRIVAKKDSSAWLGLSAIAVSASAALHLGMDALQSDSITAFWPLFAKRFSLDIAPSLDPWLLTILAAAIVLPGLVRLVSDEIGVRNKAPHGRNGALIGFAFIAFYFAARALLHGNVTASLDAHTIAGETPHRVAGFPDSASPFLWHAIVETESAIHMADLRSMGGEVSFATGVTSLHKPEPSIALSAAQASPEAREFLKFARFPKAVVQKATEGFSVEIRDMKDQAMEEKSRSIVADFTVSRDAKIVSAELQWRKKAERQ